MRFQILLSAVFGLLLAQPAAAEPYFAVQQGMKCQNCHVNPSGGGLRNDYGNLFAQINLAAEKLDKDGTPWTGRVNPYFAVGANLRAGSRYVDTPNQDSRQDFGLDEIRVYLQFSPIPQRLSVNIDQRLAPGAGQNQEAYVRYFSESREWYVKGGRMYLPFGWRLEDDSAFVREVSGINFNAPDSGVEFGWEPEDWSVQVAVSNGTAGGPEIDTGKQLSLRGERVESGWRLGASLNTNDTDLGRRDMQAIHGGIRTGPVMWLAEYDHIRDETFATGTRTQTAALLEANWLMRQGHNLKVTAETLDPDADVDDDEQQRYSLLWEYTPFQYTQIRVGTRSYDGDPLVDVQNRTELFLQWHGFF